MSILKSYLANVASAIKQKKGTDTPINAQNFASEILSIQAGGSLNVAYSLTPPTDTTKIWLQCEEPTSVEVQNYIGECAVSEVANYGVITNPVSGSSSFYSGYYSSCYIGNNQIAIVGRNHIRIFDLTAKSYIADYTISVGTDVYYTNVLFKDNVLYFGNNDGLYSFDLNTQTHTTLANSTSYTIYHIFFNSDNEIDCLIYYNSKNYRYRYDLTTNTYTQIASSSRTYGRFQYLGDFYNGGTVKIGNYIYSFNYLPGYNHYMRYNLSNNVIDEFTSWKNFCTSFSTNDFIYSTAIYDNERYVYIIGGGNTAIGMNNIIKYDVLNDSFEILDNKLLSGKQLHLSVLVDNRVYIFGGETSGTNYGRTNQIDYFDLQYPLTQNNAIITTNTINTDNALPLINTEKLKLNSNIASAYKGNADNLAEKVNAYYYDGSKWVGINCEDYVGNGGNGGGLGGSGNATTDPNIPVDKPVEM